jgi:hypothetical protein
MEVGIPLTSLTLPHFCAWEKDVTSYSVIMGMSDKHSLSPVDSNVSSVDSDLYDPQLESKSNKVKPMKDTVSDISSTNVLSNKNNVTMAVINPDLELQNFERFNTLEHCIYTTN